MLPVLSYLDHSIHIAVLSCLFFPAIGYLLETFISYEVLYPSFPVVDPRGQSLANMSHFTTLLTKPSHLILAPSSVAVFSTWASSQERWWFRRPKEEVSIALLCGP